MKSNYLQTVVAILVFITLVFLPVYDSFSQEVPDSLRTFGENMVTAIKAKDKDKFLVLVHPDVIEYMNKNNKERFDLIVNDMIHAEIPKNAEFVVQMVEEEPAYNKATQSLEIKDGRMYFPVAPSFFLYLVVPEEAKKQPNGEEKRVTAKKPIMANAITNDKGKYYIVFPVIVMDDTSNSSSEHNQSGKSPGSK